MSYEKYMDILVPNHKRKKEMEGAELKLKEAYYKRGIQMLDQSFCLNFGICVIPSLPAVLGEVCKVSQRDETVQGHTIGLSVAFIILEME